MRLRKDNFFANDTQYRIQKRIMLPYSVVSGVQIYNDTLAKSIVSSRTSWAAWSALVPDMHNFCRI